jgi:hypothetical protein
MRLSGPRPRGALPAAAAAALFLLLALAAPARVDAAAQVSFKSYVSLVVRAAFEAPRSPRPHPLTLSYYGI